MKVINSTFFPFSLYGQYNNSVPRNLLRQSAFPNNSLHIFYMQHTTIRETLYLSFNKKILIRVSSQVFLAIYKLSNQSSALFLCIITVHVSWLQRSVLELSRLNKPHKSCKKPQNSRVRGFAAQEIKPLGPGYCTCDIYSTHTGHVTHQAHTPMSRKP